MVVGGLGGGPGGTPVSVRWMLTINMVEIIKLIWVHPTGVTEVQVQFFQQKHLFFDGNGDKITTGDLGYQEVQEIGLWSFLYGGGGLITQLYR